MKKVFQACDSNKKHRFLIRFAVRIFLQSSNKSASKRKCCVAHDSDIEHALSMKSCTHCNTAFSPRSDEDRFCCHGCEFVYQMINDQGLDQFYALKQGLATVPVKSRPFEEHDFSWLPAMIETAEAEAKEEANLDLALDGISCVGCVWMIETIFARYSGSIRASAHPTQGLLHLEWLLYRYQLLDLRNLL